MNKIQKELAERNKRKIKTFKLDVNIFEDITKNECIKVELIKLLIKIETNLITAEGVLDTLIELIKVDDTLLNYFDYIIGCLPCYSLYTEEQQASELIRVLLEKIDDNISTVQEEVSKLSTPEVNAGIALATNRELIIYISIEGAHTVNNLSYTATEI